MLLSSLLPDLDTLDVTGPVDRPVRRVCHDSRDAGPTDVFVAVRGARHDGRAFARDLDVAAVIADGPVEVRPGVTSVLVPDARLALARAAAALAGHPGRAVPVVGITGTNGKTTTSWMVEAIAHAAGLRAAVIGTTGHRIAGRPGPAGFTTPEAPVVQGLLAQARDAGCGLVAMEVSSIGLALHRADAIPYRVGVFTSFSRDHLDFHGDMETYLAAKRRLFGELLAPDGTAVLNGDDPAAASLRPEGRRTWTYGRHPDHDFAVLSEHGDLRGTRARLRTPQGEVELHLRLVGPHNVDNALAAMGATLALDLPLPAALTGLAALTAVPGRLEPVLPAPNAWASAEAAPHVFVDYAHTPDALARVLAALRPLTRRRLIVVFGCGGDRDPGKRPLMGRVAGEGADVTWVTSDNPRSEDPAAIIDAIVAGIAPSARWAVEPDRATAINRAVHEAGPGDVVLIAGKGHETTQITGDLTRPFDDRAVARAALVQRTSGGGS